MIVRLYLLITVVISQIFNPTAEFAISIEIPITEANAEIETHSVTVETKISKYSG